LYLPQEGRQFKKGDDISHTEERQKKGGTVRVSGDGFKSEKSAVCEQDKIHSVTPEGRLLTLSVYFLYISFRKGL